jgi:alkyldihydroxyacetonephosphate synthase
MTSSPSQGDPVRSGHTPDSSRAATTPSGAELAAARLPGRILPPRWHPGPNDEESLDGWGFRDSHFQVLPNESVVLAGGRYQLSGLELPDLLPWIRSVLGVDFPVADVHESQYPAEVPAPRLHAEFLSEIRTFLADSAISGEPRIRLRHGHGHTLEEMYAIKYERLERVPDLVVYPDTEEQIEALVDAAGRHEVCLVPYGGGTNVSEALRCPAEETRPIVAVDLKRMNRILWIDPVNLMACIEAGAVGRQIQEQLAAHGFTLGHEPDSVELSTLGGWIATHASGMKKNRYGNIEDLVLDVRVVTPRGTISRDTALPRESVGVDPRRWILGSEGMLGIVTQAVVKLFRRPEVQRYDAMLFPSFEQGVAFMYDLTREAVPPASVRLVDNLQFQLSQTLKPKATGLRALKRKLEKKYVTRLRGFDPQRMVACTIVYEGSKADVESQDRAVQRLARRHGGMRAGAENGQRGYQLTFGIAYLRDFVMKHYILGESFETSVPWSQVLTLCAGVKRRLYEEYAGRNLPGRPFVTCRVTQVYQTGVCVYFYFGFYHRGIAEPAQLYAELERCARDEILKSGGSLSHHHGVGKIRRSFLPRIMSEAALEWSQEVKRAIDPSNIFGIANQAIEAGTAARTSIEAG